MYAVNSTALLASLAREHAARLAAGGDFHEIVDEACEGDIGTTLAYLEALRDLGTPAARRLLAAWLPIAFHLAADDLARLRELQAAEA